MSDHSDCSGDAAAYVLGALDDHEAAAFSRHMADCAICRDEVVSLQGVVDALPMAAPQVPAPSGLKRRLMAEVRSEQRLAHPETDNWWTRLRATLPVLSVGPPAFAAGAVLATVALALAIVALSSGGSGGSRVIQASVVGSSGTAALRVSGGHAELTVAHMPPPPSGRIYQVWLQRSGQQPSPTTALFSVTGNGSGSVDVPGNLHGVRVVMVTAEPLGGSPVPTRPAVIVAQLS